MENQNTPEKASDTDLFLAAVWALAVKSITKEEALANIQQLDKLHCTSFTISVDDPRDMTSEDWIAFFAYVHTLNCVISNKNALELHEQYRAMVSDIGEEVGAQYRYTCELQIFPDAMFADFNHELLD
jgi:hypothetical protein